MSIFLSAKRETYRAQRVASHGAGVTLVASAGEYVATFDCAKRVALVLGNRDLQELGDGVAESIPVFKIPTEDVRAAVEALSARFSVALVDTVCDKSESRFVLVWTIPPRTLDDATAPAEDPKQKTLSLDDF